MNISASLLYIFTAIALVLFNKNVLDGRYTLSGHVLVPLIQQTVIFVALTLLSVFSLIPPLPALKRKTLVAMLPISVSFVIYLILGMMAIAKVSIPMYASLRRFTVVFVMLADFTLMPTATFHSKNVLLTVFVQVAGCVLAAVNDLEYNPSGYAYIAMYNAATAVYLITIKLVKSKHAWMDSFAMMYLNSVILIVPLTILAWWIGDVDAFVKYEHRGEFWFLVSFLASSLLAFVLNYAIFWNTSANSALTQTVSGQIKDIGTVFLGYLVFPPRAVSWLNVTGVGMGFLGSLAYAVVKYKENMAAKTNKSSTLPLHKDDDIKQMKRVA